MGLFKRKSQSKNLDDAIQRDASGAATGATATLFTGESRFDVVGESHYQDALERICGGKKQESAHHEDYAMLLPDSENTFDPNAVGVWIGGQLVGYLSRPDAARFKSGIMRSMAETGQFCAVKVVVVGGWNRGHGDEGSFGVRLFFDPTDLE
jgi:hypothetical protein